MSRIIGVHAPQQVPAPHARPTSSTVSAPAAMLRRMSDSVTTRQRQTIMAGGSVWLKLRAA
jgi:hypothetical protein